MTPSRVLTTAALILALAACEEPSTPTDAGGDGGPTDLGASDDAGTADAGSPDAGPPDMAGRDAGDDLGLDMPLAACVGPPGLYADEACSELAVDVRPFTPRFELWSDGADKERFVYLPPGSQIDTTDPDRWGFPAGTRLYKTFARDGVRLETRVFEKTLAARGPESWTMRSWQWSADQLSVSEVGPFGETDVLGTTHDIPTRGACVECHSAAQDDVVMGFSAIQLAHSGPGVTLDELVAGGWLSTPITSADAAIPGDATTQAALGYLHANCGNCHGGPTPERDLVFWLPVGSSSAETAPTFTTSVCVCSEWVGAGPGGESVELRVAPGDSLRSVVAHRMGSRERDTKMPPLATELVDTTGRAQVIDWIDSLPADAGGCPTVCP